MNRNISSSEFNLMKHQYATSTKSAQSQFAQNKAQCKVVINTTQNDTAAVYQSPYSNPVENPMYQERPHSGSQTHVCRSAEIETTKNENASHVKAPFEESDSPDDEQSGIFLKHLNIILSNIICENNQKTLINILDGSGKIIIDVVDLVTLIGELINCDPNTVTIVYNLTEETGCFAKVNPVKKIRNIKIDNIDFQLRFNREYNILTDLYKISLAKCIIA